MDHSGLISRRIAVLVVAIFAIAALFVGRLFWIQIVDGPRLAAESESRQTIEQTVLGIRGTVVDADGTILAESVERYDITASPKFAAEFTRDGAKITVEQAVSEIATITGGDPVAMLAAIRADPESDFTYLVKDVKVDVLRAVQELKIPWAYHDLRPSRTYPQGAVAGNLVGFMGTDGPLTGVEYYLNDCLEATNGTATYERGADGIRIPGSTVTHTESVDGGKVQLTIDSDLQWFSQQTLATEAGNLGAAWATAMVVRISDGHILAAADWPSVDPNNVDGSTPENMGARLFTSPYEPGSIIKPLVVASMIERGLISPYTEIVAPSRYTVAGGAKIKDSFEHAALNLTTNGVIVQSSNTGLSTLAEGMTKKQRYEILTSWGMGSPTTVGFLGEDPGYVTNPDEVDDVTQFTQLFGQGMTVTSAQMAQIYQALGNNGVLVPLTLVTKCTAPDGTSMHEASTETRRVVSDDAAVQTIAMMENAAVFGSAANAVRVPGYRVAVKTGTAEVAKNGRYTDDRIISVAGLAPAENPQYAVVVTIGMPKFRKSSYYAGPAFAAIMGQVLKYNRVPPSSGETMVYPIYWGKDAN